VAAEYTAVVSMVLGRVSPAIVAELTPKVAQIAPVHGKAVRWSTGVCDLINACIQGEEDLFADMGPVYFFNSMCALVERRTHTMEWRPASLASYSQHYGMTTSGGNPVRIADVQYRSAAQAAGVRAGDYIIAINEVDARGMVTTEVDQLLDELHAAKAEVVLTVVVNYDMQNFEELINPEVAAPTTSRAGAGGAAGGAASAGGADGAGGAGGAGANRSEKVPMPVVWGKSTFNLKGNSSMNLLMSDAC
jgi:hypothetical protein